MRPRSLLTRAYSRSGNQRPAHPSLRHFRHSVRATADRRAELRRRGQVCRDHGRYAVRHPRRECLGRSKDIPRSLLTPDIRTDIPRGARPASHYDHHRLHIRLRHHAPIDPPPRAPEAECSVSANQAPPHAGAHLIRHLPRPPRCAHCPRCSGYVAQRHRRLRLIAGLFEYAATAEWIFGVFEYSVSRGRSEMRRPALIPAHLPHPLPVGRETPVQVHPSTGRRRARHGRYRGGRDSRGLARYDDGGGGARCQGCVGARVSTASMAHQVRHTETNHTTFCNPEVETSGSVHRKCDSNFSASCAYPVSMGF